jgi:hypothetical protein
MATNTARLPYVVVLVVTWPDKTTEEHWQSRKKRLPDALELARRTELTWIRMIGGWSCQFHWYVVDSRDYSRYNPFTTPIERTTRGHKSTRAVN